MLSTQIRRSEATRTISKVIKPTTPRRNSGQRQVQFQAPLWRASRGCRRPLDLLVRSRISGFCNNLGSLGQGHGAK